MFFRLLRTEWNVDWKLWNCLFFVKTANSFIYSAQCRNLGIFPVWKLWKFSLRLFQTHSDSFRLINNKKWKGDNLTLLAIMIMMMMMIMMIMMTKSHFLKRCSLSERLKMLLWRNFCQKSVWVNFLLFHIVPPFQIFFSWTQVTVEVCIQFNFTEILQNILDGA